MSPNISRKAFCFAVMLTLTASCAGPSKVSQTSLDTYKIEYTESSLASSPATVSNEMNSLARESCPMGFKKLEAQIIYEGYMPTHISKIQCLKEEK